jgi:hypothetical protein
LFGRSSYVPAKFRSASAKVATSVGPSFSNIRASTQRRRRLTKGPLEFREARVAEGKGESSNVMVRLKKYIEWMSRGRRTNRVAYVMKEWDLPTPLPGAEWHIDQKI